MITDANFGKSERSIRVEHHNSTNQESRTPDSLLPPSEPPDINNWFSSYEYESLVLETNDNFGFSNYEVSQGYGKECSTENIAETVENARAFARSWKYDGMMKKKTSSTLIKCNQSEENKCLNQVLDSPGSPLLSSEPPGIDNWFCSYEYESPAPDTLDHLILSHHKESMADKEGHCNGKRKEVENVDEMICSQRLEECDNGSTKDGKNSTENHLQNKLPNHESVGTDMDSNENAQLSSCKRDPAAANSANGNSWERTGSSKHEEEEEEEGGVGNGFVSIRSMKRIKDDKSMRVNGKRSSSSVVGKMKDERTPLADMTNIHPGKWKCPRKSKPDIGPPLKQLQIGHWFRRQ